jgi:hypothetical protein
MKGVFVAGCCVTKTNMYPYEYYSLAKDAKMLLCSVVVA